MRLTQLTLSLVIAALLLPAALSPTEAQEGWIVLHDGESSVGWAGDSANFVSGGGVLSIEGTGLLRSQSPFTDFVLRFDVRAMPNGPLAPSSAKPKPMVGSRPTLGSRWKGK